MAHRKRENIPRNAQWIDKVATVKKRWPDLKQAATHTFSLFTFSKHIAIRRRPIPFLTVLQIRKLAQRHLIPLPVDALIIPPQAHDRTQTHGEEGQLQRVSQDILRAIRGAVEIARHCPGQVAQADVDCHAGGSLVASGQIVRDPGDVAGEGGIDAADGDEDACVHDARDPAVRRGGDADDEADPDGAHAAEDVGGALARAVREPGDSNGKDGGGDVDGDGEELCGGGSVAEFADDGGEEEGGAVQWTNNAPVH